MTASPPVLFQQPFGRALADARRVLLAGCGGGYDILGAVPITAELLRTGKQCFFASLSFSQLDRLPGHEAVAAVPHLFRALPAGATEKAYCPEAWLSEWMSSRGPETAVWCFENVGVRPLRFAYESLVHSLEIDTIVLIDGGIDSVLRGDEVSMGTPAEDFASLAAVAPLAVERKLLACIGFGAEMRDGICHAQALERVAELMAIDAFLGLWPLLPGSAAADEYRSAAEYIALHQHEQRGSHIHSVVRAALSSEFGPRGEDVWISPLSALFWFFDLDTVARTNLLLPNLSETDTLWEIAAIIEATRKSMKIRPRCDIPL